MRNIDELLQDGGSVSIEPLDDIPCVACAADVHNTIALLVRRNGESLTALLKRLDKAVARYYSDTVVTDETEEQG